MENGNVRLYTRRFVDNARFLREGKIEEVGDDWRDSVDQFVELQFGLFILFRSFSY